MPPSIPTFSTDQFDNSTPARGDLSMAISQTRILPGVLKDGETVAAGDRVKIDDANTVPGLVVFVPAADDEAAFGVVKRTVKQTTFIGGNEDTNKLEVAFSGGQCVYEVGSTTLAPGTPVAMSSGFLAVVDGSHVQMGLLIDAVVQSSMGRVIVGWTPC